jgi:hypothetical protein
MNRALVIVFGALLSALALAQQAPIVRVDVEPEVVAVGEVARLRITILVPTWFTTAPSYPTFELPNLITRLPPNSSWSTSERIEGEIWSGIVRDYQVYPLLGARYRMTGEALTVTYAEPGASEPTVVDMVLPDIEISGQVPVGAESLDPYIAGSDLRLRREIDGPFDSLEAGDALVVRYIAELQGMPALFLPPLVSDVPSAGLSMYADAPLLEEPLAQEGAAGGTGVARRTEKVTWVFKYGGEYTLPGATLNWWNTQTGEVETATVDPLVVSVTGPGLAALDSDTVAATDWQSITLGVLGLGLLGWLLRRWGPGLMQHLRSQRVARRQSEMFAFRWLRKAINQREPRAVHHALLVWLQRLEPGGDARQFAGDYGDASLQASVDALSAAVYANSGQIIDFTKLYQGLVAARRNYKQSRSEKGRCALPPLNP